MTDEQKNNEETKKADTAPQQEAAPADKPSSPEKQGGEQASAPAKTDAKVAPDAKGAPGRDSRGPGGPGGRGRGGFQGRTGRGRGPGGPGGRGRGRGPRQGRGREKPEFESKTLDIARVSRMTKGGKRFSFRATVVIGDQKSRVGVGIGKGKDVVKSIQKAYAQARKEMMEVIIVEGTIPYQVEAKYSSAKVLLKPSKGGIKAGGAVRVVAQLAGIHSLTGKNLGRTSNKLNIARATVAALKKVRPTGTKTKPAVPKPVEAEEADKKNA